MQLGAQRDTGNDPLGLDAARVLAAFMLATFVLGSVALAITGLWEPRTYGAFELVRNTAGYAGLVAGAATLIGARLALAPAFGYAAVVYIAAPKPLRADTAWWTCPLQPWTTTRATWIAVALFAARAVLYARFGPALPRPTEHSSG